MAWESDDVLRSIRRYLEPLLADDWTIRIERREVRDDERPIAAVELGTEAITRAREALTQGNVESLYPVTISAYPKLTEDAEDVDGMRASALEARTLSSLLRRWLLHGLTVRDKDGRDWAGPFRIPLYDYAEVPLKGADRAGPEDPMDVLWVQRESVNVHTVQDDEDLRRWSVFAEFRITLEAPGRERAEDEGYEVTDGLEGSFVPPPG